MNATNIRIEECNIPNLDSFFAYASLKRVMDVSLSLLFLIALSPVLLFVGLLVKLTSRGSVIFKQERVGKDRKTFTMYKFRSMYEGSDKIHEYLSHLNERDGPVFKITNDPRQTSIGKFMRRTCIDELPQLWNILNGDMSFVGPRPPMPLEVEQYEPWQLQRLDAQPGLTCFWQISRREMSFDDWVQSDIEYISQQSLSLDLLLIIKTLPVFVVGHK